MRWASILGPAFALTLTAPSAAAAAATHTLGALVSAPYATSIAAARDAPRVAWTVTAAGVGQIWIADAPTFRPRRLDASSADDGLPINKVAIAPDGSRVAVVRGVWGGGNPASLALGGDRTVHIIDVASGATRDLGPGGEPSFAPDGRLLFRRGGQLWVEGANGRADPLFRDLGGVGALAWSPDGASLAFVSQRAGRSVIGVYRADAPRITWLSPEAGYDQAPAWAPDGRSIAFLRVGGVPRGGPPIMVAGRELEVWIADALTGVGRRLWRAPGASGGFVQQTRGPRALEWNRDGGLTFVSEHEGWARIYALRPGAVQPHPITPDQCEAYSPTSLGGGATLFVSNCAAADQRELWLTQEGKSRPLTAGAVDTDPSPLGERYVAFRRGEGRRPQTAAILDRQTGRIQRLETEPLGFEPQRLVLPQSVSFAAADGRMTHGQLFLPPGGGNGRPALVFVHGGPEYQTYAGWHDLGVFAMSYAVHQALAQRGYVVLSVNFRMGIGHGRDNRAVADAGPRGASEYRDVLGAQRFLAARPEVDPSRIGIWGGSYGGYLTALALARNSDLFAAGADISGFHDFTHRWTSGLAPADTFVVTADMQATAWASSPLADVDRWRSPVLIVAGDRDQIIPVDESLDLVRRLRARGVPVVASIVPDEEHIFVTHSATLAKLDLMSRFFDCTLRDRAADVSACVEGPVRNP